jgi:adenylate cyclase
MVELERTFLAKHLPQDLHQAASKAMLDIYIPKDSHHPILRIRKNGEKFEITKKSPVHDGDASRQNEETIHLTEAEYQELALIEGKRVHKVRYQYDHGGYRYEIDVFQDALQGLVLVDIEFATEQELAQFEKPEFCLVEVTQATFLAGGMLCGKTYADLEENLKRLGYQRLAS